MGVLYLIESGEFNYELLCMYCYSSVGPVTKQEAARLSYHGYNACCKQCHDNLYGGTLCDDLRIKKVTEGTTIMDYAKSLPIDDDTL